MDVNDRTEWVRCPVCGNKTRNRIREDETHQKGNLVTMLEDKTLIYLPQLLYNIKHSSWSYEKEYRCIIASTANGMPFIDANIRLARMEYMMMCMRLCVHFLTGMVAILSWVLRMVESR